MCVALDTITISTVPRTLHEQREAHNPRQREPSQQVFAFFNVVGNPPALPQYLAHSHKMSQAAHSQQEPTVSQVLPHGLLLVAHPTPRVVFQCNEASPTCWRGARRGAL